MVHYSLLLSTLEEVESGPLLSTLEEGETTLPSLLSTLEEQEGGALLSTLEEVEGGASSRRSRGWCTPPFLEEVKGGALLSSPLILE